MTEHHYTILRFLGDLLSMTALFGSIFHQLPDIAAIFTIVWTSIRIYETDTVRQALRAARAKQQLADLPEKPPLDIDQ